MSANRPYGLIYVIRFFSYGVWGVVYPFLAVWLLGLDLFDESAVGVVIGAAVIANRIGALVFVRVVERHDKRAVIVASQLAAIAAAVGMHVLAAGATRSVLAWLAVGVAFGLANSVATLAQLTYIAQQFPPEEGTKAFAYENVALNIAGGVMPLLSAFTILRLTGQYALVPIVFAVVGIVLALRLPRDAVAAPSRAVADLAGRPEWTNVTILLGFNFLTLLVYAQFYGVYPVYAVEYMGEGEIGLLFAASSVLIVLLQALVTRVAARSSDLRMIVAANVVMAAGSVLLVLTTGSFALALVAVLCIVLGEMVYGPLYQVLAVRVFRSRATLAMGAVTFVWGVSESAAIFAGLALVGAGIGHVSFLIGAAAGLLVAVLAVALRNRMAGFEPVGPEYVEASRAGQ